MLLGTGRSIHFIFFLVRLPREMSARLKDLYCGIRGIENWRKAQWELKNRAMFIWVNDQFRNLFLGIKWSSQLFWTSIQCWLLSMLPVSSYSHSTPLSNWQPEVVSELLYPIRWPCICWTTIPYFKPNLIFFFFAIPSCFLQF